MGIFGSKFKALEAYADTPAASRTPEMLSAVQRELDAAGAALIAVPTSKTLATPDALDAHINGLETRAASAEASLKTAQEKLTAAEGEVKKLMGSAPPDQQPDTPTSGKDTPPPSDETPQNREKRELKERVAALPHNEAARRLLGQD